MTKKIIIAGEGGQGIQVIAKIIAQVVFSSKKHITYLPNFGVEQRGGVSIAYIQISDNEISFPKFHQADIAVLLSERAIKRTERHFGPETVILFDNSLIAEKHLEDYKLEKIAIPAQYVAKGKLVPKVFNMIILGALAEEIGLKQKIIKAEMLKFFAAKIKKEPGLKHFNIRAIEFGVEMLESLKKEKTWRLKILEK